MVHHAVAARIGHQFGAVAHQAARRDQVAQAHARLALRLHVQHRTLALAELFDDHAGIFLRHIHSQLLDRLGGMALLVLAEDDLRP